jgi:hypothetical protein
MDDVEPTGARSVKRTRIGEAFPAVGAKMTFLFDYGDEWHFHVEVIGRGRKEAGTEYPLLVKSVGQAPPQYSCPEDDEEEREAKNKKRT